MTTLLQDLRYGLRTLSKSPAFTVIALVYPGVGHRRPYGDLQHRECCVVEAAAVS